MNVVMLYPIQAPLAAELNGDFLKANQRRDSERCVHGAVCVWFYWWFFLGGMGCYTASVPSGLHTVFSQSEL